MKKNKEVGEKSKEIIENIKKQKRQYLEVFVFASGEDLLKNIENMELVFLDIEMPKIDGIELGKEIEYTNPNCKIIITSKNAEHEKKVSYIRSIGFLLKPFEEYEVKKLLEEAGISNNVNSFLRVYDNRKLYMISQTKIKYIKAYNGSIEIMTENQRFRKGISLRKAEDMLDGKLFYQIHRNCIVNLAQIVSYKEGKIQVEMEELEVSARKRKQFEKVYMQFKEDYKNEVKEF